METAENTIITASINDVIFLKFILLSPYQGSSGAPEM